MRPLGTDLTEVSRWPHIGAIMPKCAYSTLTSVTAIAQAVTDLVVQVPESLLISQGLEIGSYKALTFDESQSLLHGIAHYPHLYSPGGAVANTLDGIAALGSPTTLITGVGRDLIGESYLATCRKRSTVVHEISADPSVSALSISLVIPNGERTMRTFLGASSTLDPARLLNVSLHHPTLVVVEGYLVANGLGPNTHQMLLAYCDHIRDAGSHLLFALPPVSVLSEWLPVTRAIASKANLVAGNLDEFQTLLSINEVAKIRVWGEQQNIDLLVTDGPRGAHALIQGECAYVPAPEGEVVDLTGAGDAFLAGFIHSLIHGTGTDDALRMGAMCAGRVIGQLGARFSLST